MRGASNEYPQHRLSHRIKKYRYTFQLKNKCSSGTTCMCIQNVQAKCQTMQTMIKLSLLAQLGVSLNWAFTQTSLLEFLAIIIAALFASEDYINKQKMTWSNGADMQNELCLLWSHIPKAHFHVARLMLYKRMQNFTSGKNQRYPICKQRLQTCRVVFGLIVYNRAIVYKRENFPKDYHLTNLIKPSR